MSARTPRPRTSLAAAATLALIAVGCGTTTINETGNDGFELAESDTSPLDDGAIVDASTPETTIPIEGSAADLLPEIGIDMSRLSAEINGDGDEDATLARIEGNWAAIQEEIATTHPELVNSIQATVDMARTAVESNRPADADKAFSLLNTLVDAFTGDS